MVGFTYMGTKKQLAETISSSCVGLPGGPFLDLFSGISAAGASVATSRQVWCNDAQHFSRTLTEALYRSADGAPRIKPVRDAILKHGNANLNVLASLAAPHVDKELSVLWDGSVELQISLQSDLRSLSASWADWPQSQTHCLFTINYAGSYIGLTQAMQLDSIRFGADKALTLGEITAEEHRWALLALCRALAGVSNSTGHFAQYLTPSEANIKRVVSKRRRCAWACWYDALSEMRPLGSKRWRKKNRVFHGDAVEVLKGIQKNSEKPGIIYADPPYTADQYSRYYHLFETALLYDYPSSTGKGLYREGRFQSKFSLSKEVEGSFKSLIEAAGSAGGSLMISYPSNGLLPNALETIPDMMSQFFRDVRDPLIIPYKHSTLGASKGRQKEDVEECLFIAVN